jgi:hypothetical protein
MSARADELVATELERRCLEELRRASGEVDGAMERHCVRNFLFCEQLAAKRGLTIDREVTLGASFLHDIGIYDSITHGGVYTDEGGEFAERLYLDGGATPARAALARDACAYHHAVTNQTKRGVEVELMRLADRIEVSGGLIPAGLPREQIRALFAEVPRDGFYRGIGGLVAHVLAERPLSLPRIFKVR